MSVPDNDGCIIVTKGSICCWLTGKASQELS